MKLTAQIRHGNYNETISATGATVAECLTTLSRQNTYIPTPEFSKYSQELVLDLESTGQGAMGWVDYHITQEL